MDPTAEAEPDGFGAGRANGSFQNGLSWSHHFQGLGKKKKKKRVGFMEDRGEMSVSGL